MVQAAVVRWTWRCIARDHPELSHLANGGADLKPIVDLLSKVRKDWTKILESFFWGGVTITVTTGGDGPEGL